MPKVQTLNNTSYSASKLYPANCNHVWTLCDYEDLIFLAVFQNKTMVSEPFHLMLDLPDGDSQKLTFQLTAKSHENKNVWIALEWINQGYEKVRIKFRLYILNRNGDHTMEREDKFRFNNYEHWIGGPTAFSRDKLALAKDDILVDGCLRVGCWIEVLCDCPQESSTAARTINMALEESDDTLIKCFGNLLENKRLSDVKLLCNGVKFDCHKLVLAARSDVFSAMFSHENTKEAATNVVNITDSTPDEVREMLNYLYTDKCEKMEGNALGLLSLAEKYNLPRLKLKCESWLADNISKDNAVDIFLLADMFRSSQLASIALNYVALHLVHIRGTAGWKRIEEKSEVLGKLLEITTAPGYPHCAIQTVGLKKTSSSAKL